MSLLRHIALLTTTLLVGTAAQTAAAKSFVWTVSDQDSTLYLVGSMHLLPDEAYPLAPALEQAYSASDVLVLETDINGLQSPAKQLSMMRMALDPTAEPMRARLSASQYSRLGKLTQRLGVPLSSLDAMKNWFASVMLELSAYQAAGFRPELGLDMHFAKRAARDKKPMVPLEQIDAHIDLIAGMSDDTGLAMLTSTIDALNDQPELPGTLFRIWQTGDADAMAEQMQALSDADQAAYERLLTRRNHAWMPPLLTLLDGSRDVMVVVGAAHLAGEDGLVDLFEQRGYRLQQQ